MDKNNEKEFDEFLNDVFLRADKNDDGKLQLEEFYSYFEDQVLDKEDLDELFIQIDKDSNKNIDIDELKSYLLTDFSSFSDIFKTLQSLNVQMNELLHLTHSKYNENDFFGKFRMRFFLKEICHQLRNVHKPVDSAVTALEIFTERRRQRVETISSNTPQHPTHKHETEEIHHNNIDGIQSFTKQVDRLKKLLDKFSSSNVKILPKEEEIFETGKDKDNKAFIMISRDHKVKPEQLEDYEEALKSYVHRSQNEDGNVKVSVKQIKDEHRYIIYEIWDSESSHEQHTSQSYYSEHSNFLKTGLTENEAVSTMNVPSTWF
eukprot:TRINITY_DN6593_c0_g1_i1.p1 TRINITY_DN6593_c0_g1~~TRINITY_DN6593_c0_g1_i1.p1  ORF type:complete len:332 (-),score=118.67 TRINITY_DN6593_c0_g1_i1:41-994(-)